MEIVEETVWLRSRHDINFPSAWRAQGGDLFLRYTIGTHAFDERRAHVVSEDGGQTWRSDPNPLLDHATYQEVVRLRDGSLLASQFAVEDKQGEHLPTFRSWDDGRTWTEERLAMGATGGGPMGHLEGGGRMLWACGHPAEQADGTLLIPMYGFRGERWVPGEYETWMAELRPGETWLRPLGMVASGENRGWGEGPCEPDISYEDDDHIVCIMRTGGPSIICHSEDAGRTWSEPETWYDPIGVYPRLVRLPDGGPLVAAIGQRGSRPGVALRTSTDGGRTWSGPFVAYEGPGCQYTSLVADGPDRLLLVYCAGSFCYSPDRAQERTDSYNELRAATVVV